MGSTGDPHAAKAAAGTLLSVLMIGERQRESAGRALTLLGRTASPHRSVLACRQTDAGEGRGILSSWPMQRCQEVQKLLISGRGCIEMRFPAGELRISAEPGFPA